MEKFYFKVEFDTGIYPDVVETTRRDATHVSLFRFRKSHFWRPEWMEELEPFKITKGAADN